MIVDCFLFKQWNYVAHLTLIRCHCSLSCSRARLDEDEPRHGVPRLLLDRGEVRARLLLKLHEKAGRRLRHKFEKRCLHRSCRQVQRRAAERRPAIVYAPTGTVRPALVDAVSAAATG